MNKKAGMLISAIIIFASLIIGFSVGYKLDNYFCRESDGEVNELLKSEIKDLKNQLEVQCEYVGGQFIEGNGIFICSLPTSDGGKECLDSDECEADCLASEGAKDGDEVAGSCAGYTANYGYFVESGKVTGPFVD